MSDDFRPDSMVWVFTEREFQNMLAMIEQCQECVIDLETTGLDEHATKTTGDNGGVPARVVLASLTLPMPGQINPPREGIISAPTTWVLPLSHPDSPWLGTWRQTLKRVALALEEHEVPLVNQHMKFDAKWVYATTRVNLSKQIRWCTQVASSLIDETKSTKLKERAPEVFGVDRWDDIDLTYPGAAEEADLTDLGVYAARDTYWTWRLYRYQLDKLFLGTDDQPFADDEIEDARLGRLSRYCTVPSTAALTAIEQRGMVLDTEAVQEKLMLHDLLTAELSEKLAARYEVDREDGPSFAPTSHWFRAWAEQAVEAGDLRVTAMTGQGNPQWTKEVLSKQAIAGSEVAADLLKYRRLSKQSEFLRTWLHRVTPFNTIHTTYNVGGAASGRLSSSGPNMQQVTKELRPMFGARPGFVIADFDYSQIEMRVAAFLSRSEPMIEAFRRGDDLHRVFAANLEHLSPSEVTEEGRQKAKAGNFGLLFDMSAEGFQLYAEANYGVVLTIEEAVEVREGFFTTWAGIREWQDRQRRRVHATGQVVSPIGRVRRIPDIFSDDPRRVGAAERVAINSPVQGFASDLMQMAAAIIEGTMPGYDPIPGVRLVGTVHDSIVAELPEDRWKSCAAAVLEAMVDGVLSVLRRMECDFDVPLQAEASVGTKWFLKDVGEMEARTLTHVR